MITIYNFGEGPDSYSYHIWDSDGSEYVDIGLLACNAVCTNVSEEDTASIFRATYKSTWRYKPEY